MTLLDDAFIVILAAFTRRNLSTVCLLFQVEVGEGEEAVLECGVQGLASIHMVWNIFHLVVEQISCNILSLESCFLPQCNSNWFKLFRCTNLIILRVSKAI